MRSPLRPVQRFLMCAAVLLVLVAGAAPALAWDYIVNGKQPGPVVMVLVPAAPEKTTMCLAEQLARVPLERGALAIAAVGEGGEAPDVASAAPLGSPMVIVRVTADLDAEGSSSKVFPPALETNDGARGGAVLGAALAEVPGLTLTVVPAEGEAEAHTLRIAGEPVPLSRQIRWGRLFVTELLASHGMVASRPQTTELIVGGERTFAMYDCEGVGGSGPDQLRRIVERIAEMNATLTPISPHDVREGVLANFSGVIFPGGGGRAIAEALEPSGQQIVRDFIAAGGGYVGVCAGAYLATCRIDGYLGMVGAYHGQPWRKGTGMVDIELTPEGEKIFGAEYKTFQTRYNNGPILVHEDGLVPEGEFPPIVSLATFRSAVNNPDGEESAEMVDTPAIVASDFGKGRVLLISPHPETHEVLFPMVARGLLWSAALESAVAPETATASN